MKPVPVTLTDKEREYSQLIPRRLFKVYSEEAQNAGGRRPAAGRGGRPRRPARRRGDAALRAGCRAWRPSEIANFIDGTRSVLDIYNAVRAECGNLVVGSNDTKFAYLLSPDAPDVDLDLVYAALEALQKGGTIEMHQARAEARARQEAEEIAKRRRRVRTKIGSGPTIRRLRTSYGSETETYTPP